MINIMKEHNNFISRPEIQFWFPIIITIVSIASSFFYLSSRLALLEQKQEQTNSLIIEHLKKAEAIIEDYNKYKIITDSRITKVETLEGVKGR